MKLTSVRDVAGIMNRHGLKFNKGYGHNFLINEAVPKRIAAECGADPDSGILEIGPGIGTLTRELCARYRKVVAVEIDTSLIPALKETTADLDNLVIINDDIMKTDLIIVPEISASRNHSAVDGMLPHTCGCQGNSRQQRHIFPQCRNIASQ